MKPKVNILYSPGTNCHHETAKAFQMAGADTAICNLTDDLLSGKKLMTDCDLLAVPGGFSFGDHLGAGRIFGLDLITRLKDQLLEVREKRIPMIGICNGFQILMNTGLLPGTDPIGEPHAVLDRNCSAVFESRWVTLSVENKNSIWTQSATSSELRMPVAHGEGRLLLRDGIGPEQTVFRYKGKNGKAEYPFNPNGSPEDRAGITDPEGLILGLMPHPERAIYPWNGSEDGLQILRSGVEAVAG